MPKGERPEKVDALGGAGLEAVVALGGVAFPGAGPVAQLLFQGARREWDRLRSTALRAAEASSGLSREDIAEQVAADPRLIPLATRLLYAAGINGHDRTLHAMGSAFGDAVRDRGALEECELILTSLDGLTDTHAAILSVMTQPLPPAGGRPGRWTTALVVDRSDLSNRVVTLCLAGLVTRGLVETNPSIGGGTLYVVTELGLVVLDVLAQYSAAQR